MNRRARFVLTIAGIAGVIAIYVAIAPASAGSGRLVALHRFLPGVGIDVAGGAGPPGSGTYVLVADRRSRAQDDELLRWVEGGGRLVVTDPGSQLFSMLGVSSSRAGIMGTTTIAADCVRPETLGVHQVEISSSDRLLSSASVARCFGIGESSFALFVPRGSGVVVLLGGSSSLSDRLLDHADNAVFAEGVLGPGPVTFGPPGIAEVSAGLWSLLPPGAKIVVLESILATVVFAFARGRRLGRPIPEEPVSPIRSGELVDATARLYRRAHARVFCVETLRTWTIDRLSRRLGIPGSGDQVGVASTIARSAGVDPLIVEHAIAGPPPADDEQFVAVCQELDALSEQIGGTQR